MISVAPMGEGAAVLFRQRFGNLVAGRDGLLSVGVRDGAVWYVSSSLARDARHRRAATLSAAEAAQIATADAGLEPDRSCRRRAGRGTRTADRGARAAYQVILMAVT